MTIVISGASGFVGRRLMKALSGANHTIRVLSRHAGTNLPAGVKLCAWDPMKGPPPGESLSAADAVVRLDRLAGSTPVPEPLHARCHPEGRRKGFELISQWS